MLYNSSKLHPLLVWLILSNASVVRLLVGTIWNYMNILYAFLYDMADPFNSNLVSSGKTRKNDGVFSFVDIRVFVWIVNVHPQEVLL